MVDRWEYIHNLQKDKSTPEARHIHSFLIDLRIIQNRFEDPDQHQLFKEGKRNANKTF